MSPQEHAMNTTGKGEDRGLGKISKIKFLCVCVFFFIFSDSGCVLSFLEEAVWIRKSADCTLCPRSWGAGKGEN